LPPGRRCGGFDLAELRVFGVTSRNLPYTGGMRCRFRLIFAMATAGLLSGAQAFDWANAMYWKSPYGGEWFTPRWTNGLYPSKTTDVGIGHAGFGINVPFSGRVTLTNSKGSVRSIESRGSIRLTNGELNIYGDTHFPLWGGFELLGSTIVVANTSYWAKTRYFALSGLNYLDVLTNQTLNLNGSLIRADNAQIRQRNWLYRPGNIVNNADIEAINGGSIALSGQSFTNNGGLWADGPGSKLELAYNNFLLTGSLNALNGGFLAVYRRFANPVPITVRDMRADKGSKILVSLPQIEFGGNWICDETSEIALKGSVGAGTRAWRQEINASNFASRGPKGIHFEVEPGGFGLWQGGLARDSSLGSLKSFSPDRTLAPTRIRDVEFPSAFEVQNNKVEFESCLGNLISVVDSQVTFRDFSLSRGRYVAPFWLVFDSREGGGNTVLQQNHLDFVGMMTVLSPTTFETSSTAPTEFRFSATTEVHAEISLKGNAQLVNGSFLDVVASGTIPSMVNTGFVNLRSSKLQKGNLISSGYLGLIPTSDAAGFLEVMQGFRDGIETTGGSTTYIEIRALPRTTIVQSHGMRLGGRLIITIDTRVKLGIGQTFDIIRGPITYGSGFSVQYDGGPWKIVTSPIGIWAVRTD